jgi:hypothetical protein
LYSPGEAALDRVKASASVDKVEKGAAKVEGSAVNFEGIAVTVEAAFSLLDIFEKDNK